MLHVVNAAQRLWFTLNIPESYYTGVLMVCLPENDSYNMQSFFLLLLSNSLLRHIRIPRGELSYHGTNKAGHVLTLLSTRVLRQRQSRTTCWGSSHRVSPKNLTYGHSSTGCLVGSAG